MIPVPVDLSKLSNVVKADVVEKAVYDKLVEKVENIDTSWFVLKAICDTDKSELEKKIPGASKHVKKTDYNAKISEIEGKIPSISGLATTSVLTVVENKIPDVISLVKKTNYNTKISKIEKKLTDHNHDKHITTPEFNKFAKELFNERLNQAHLVTKTYFDTKLINLNKKINANKTKHLLSENEIKNPKNIWFRLF